LDKKINDTTRFINGMARFVFIVLQLFIGLNCNNSRQQELLSAKIELGRYLFFDTRLSFNNTRSCASCHDPKFAFTDGYRRSITANGKHLKHNSPSLLNVGDSHFFDLANATVTSLEMQHLRPLNNKSPIELGFNQNKEQILNVLNSISIYKKLTAFAYGKENLDEALIINSIATFVGSLKSQNSVFDLWNSTKTAISADAQRGFELFRSGRFKCIQCHSLPHFTSATQRNSDSVYFNIGLYNLDKFGTYPNNDNGLYDVTGKATDKGKYKAPSLRNVALTAPYFHDGSADNLQQVLDVYEHGGRINLDNQSYGDGRNNPNKDPRISGINMSKNDRIAIIAFLYSLTDTSAINNPNWQNPWKSMAY
jgi:cytochrome c peroxidase